MLVAPWTEYVRDNVQALGFSYLPCNKEHDRSGYSSVIEKLLYRIQSLDWLAGDDCMK